MAHVENTCATLTVAVNRIQIFFLEENIKYLEEKVKNGEEREAKLHKENNRMTYKLHDVTEALSNLQKENEELKMICTSARKSFEKLEQSNELLPIIEESRTPEASHLSSISLELSTSLEALSIEVNSCLDSNESRQQASTFATDPPAISEVEENMSIMKDALQLIRRLKQDIKRLTENNEEINKALSEKDLLIDDLNKTICDLRRCNNKEKKNKEYYKKKYQDEKVKFKTFQDRMEEKKEELENVKSALVREIQDV